MTTPNELPLSMPRRLAILLLHEAQIAEQPLFGLVAAPIAEGCEPDAWMPLPDLRSVEELAVKLQAAGKRSWAFYFYRPSQQAMPAGEDFIEHPELLRLTASLAIKGVLQLRAWHCRDGRVLERELNIHD